jgi:RNA recognition motif-containing protein
MLHPYLNWPHLERDKIYKEYFMGKKIYVGNLPFTATSESLSEIFSSFGIVDSSKIVMDRDSGRSKGFGFVEMSLDHEAISAIEKLQGSDFGGRALTVNEARPMEKRPSSQAGSFQRNHSTMNYGNSVQDNSGR